jgi:hypothetical protein
MINFVTHEHVVPQAGTELSIKEIVSFHDQLCYS